MNNQTRPIAKAYTTTNIGIIKTFLAVTILVIFATIFFFPTLTGEETMIHGETVSLWIPLNTLLHDAIHNGGSLLWTDKIYGGHPLFAEGQGAFAQPLNLILATLFQPIQAYNLFNWLSLTLSLAGMYALCRKLGCSRTASIFAALAASFSTIVIGSKGNMAMAGTLTWVPWSLWAMHHWLKNRNISSASLFGVTMCFMIFGGYPHIVHGTIIYMAVYLITSWCFQKERHYWSEHLSALLSTGSLAVIICCGLAAVQLLPLLELAGQSHRSDGIEIIQMGKIAANWLLRGYIYSFDEATSNPSSMRYFGIIGSLLVCFIASFALLLKPDRKTIAHGSATLFLTLLGFGTATPIFNWLYDAQLVPGLNSFRIMFLYLHLSVIGISIMTALSIDRLAKFIDDRGTPTKEIAAITLVIISFWILIGFTLHSSDAPITHYVTAALSVVFFATAYKLNNAKLFTTGIALLLCFEILFLRINSLHFADTKLISKPLSLQTLEKTNSLTDYKVLDYTDRTAYAFLPSTNGAVKNGMQKMINSMSPASNILWGAKSLIGNIALPTARFELAKKLITQELEGLGGDAGLRLIDFMGLKYVTVQEPLKGSGFIETYYDQILDVRIVKNQYAYPRFQTFNKAIAVNDYYQAIETIRKLKERTLIIESEKIPAPLTVAIQTDNSHIDTIHFTLITDTPTRYQLEIDAPKAGWLLLADSHYPGWKAYIDGKETALYAGQVLGKSVQLPAGQYLLTFKYQPQSFRLGLVISMTFLTILPLVFGYKIIVKLISTRMSRQ